MQDNQREEISYLAGLFDGEGTICIQKDTRPLSKDNGRNWNPIYNVTFRVGMTHQRAVERFKEFFKVGFIDCEKSYHQFRPMWRYSIRRKDDVKNVIEKIHPHLMVKKEQAIMALCYFEDCPSQRGRYLTPEILEKKEWYYQQMRKLNGVDISPATTKRMGRAKSMRVCDSLNSMAT
jgi:LAGLIDADG endonuclease